MKLVDAVLSQKEIVELHKHYGGYVKITAEIEKEELIVGTELHADGEKVLLTRGGQQDNIWGGGIDLEAKIVDTTAVLNLRPCLGNDSLEILLPEKREKFIKLVKKYFVKLWS
ncbi:MAG: DUF5674 family protein [Candidatus Shapirobacteria bacterium]